MSHLLLPEGYNYIWLLQVLSTVMESYGDYHATASAAQSRSPPLHAVNRGIMMEGLASIYGSLVGISHATSSYSSQIGIIVYTGVC